MLPCKPHIWYDITNAGMSWICGSPSVYATPPYGHGDTPVQAYCSWVQRCLSRGIRVVVEPKNYPSRLNKSSERP